ncbi:MAG: aminotransferase class I/II-fold pyridoxal phosphate-dependent enzyme [Planctomycetota bacterium]|nr:aminotransferase class I/II-fold pyridoxal phosphate-dependent enzyme [Planctomycetota bacterium]
MSRDHHGNLPERMTTVIGSKRISSIGTYAMAAVRERTEQLRAKGLQPVDFGMGDPSAATPELIRRACAEGIERHAASGYPPFAGSQPFRQAVAHWFEGRFGVSIDPETEIVSSVGSKESIFHLPEALIDPGDVVICPDPGYPPYSGGTLFAEGEAYFTPIQRATDFLPDLDSIPDAIAERAKMFWLTTPSSPSGRVASPQYLKRWVQWCRERDILACSDEAYSEIYFGDPPHSALEQGKEGVLVFNSLSKRSAMTGYRVGWVAGDPRVIALYRKLKANIDTGTPWFIQEAAIAAYSDESHVAQMRDGYRKRRDLFVSAFEQAGLPRSEPEASLYVWQRAPDGVSSTQLAEALLDEKILAVTIPSAALVGDPDRHGPGEQYVRLSMVASWPESERIAAAIAEHLRLG